MSNEHEAEVAAAREQSKYPDYISRCDRGPVTRAWLREDLRRLGLREVCC